MIVNCVSGAQHIRTAGVIRLVMLAMVPPGLLRLLTWRDNVYTDQMLEYIHIIEKHGGPRSAYAFFLGRKDYITNTADLVTADVETFIMDFYHQYNNRFGMTY
jgi:hypothetical protein